MKSEKKKNGNKLVISIITATFILGVFAPIASSMSCNTDYWGYAGHWVYDHYREKVYTDSYEDGDFFAGEIVGIDDGGYYYYVYSVEEFWKIVWGTTQDGPDVHIYHYPH